MTSWARPSEPVRPENSKELVLHSNARVHLSTRMHYDDNFCSDVMPVVVDLPK